MRFENIIYCHWDIVRLIFEENLKTEEGKFRTLSVTCAKDIELMIFLEKSDDEYEVRVYKNKPTDKYVPNDLDNVKNYEENDEYATFFFENFENAKRFTDTLPYIHPEYKSRPIRKIEE